MEEEIFIGVLGTQVWQAYLLIEESAMKRVVSTKGVQIRKRKINHSIDFSKPLDIVHSILPWGYEDLSAPIDD